MRDKIYISGILKNVIQQKSINKIQESDKTDVVNSVLDVSKNIFMFYSNGIYEYVLGGANIINFDIRITENHHNNYLRSYFTNQRDYLYNYDGVVKTVGILSSYTDWNFEKYNYSSEKKKKWIDRFLGIEDLINISKNIAAEIIE